MKRRSQQYYKPRSIRIQERRSQSKFVYTVVAGGILLLISLYLGLPFLISNLAFINHKVNSRQSLSPSEDITLAPPVLNIPYEATNTATINFSGFAAVNSKVEIYLDDILQKEITVKDDGTFNMDSLELNLGTNNIYGKTKSAQNTISLPSKTIIIHYSSEKPKLIIKEPEDLKIIKGGDKKVKIAGQTDPNNNLTINDGVVILTNDGSFLADKELNDGENIFILTATNSFGNFTTNTLKVTYQSE